VNGEAVKAIVDEATKPLTLSVHGREHLLVPTGPGTYEDAYVDRPESVPAALALHTLTGVVDYLIKNRDELKPEELMVLVSNPRKVEVGSKLVGSFAQRKSYVVAECDGPRFAFGQYMLAEDFVVALQSQFVVTPDIAAVWAVVGNIKESAVRTTADDGVSQTVTAASGIARVENVDVPRIVKLRPFRTFAEVEQPESTFLLRMRGGDANSKPTAALFEADGGAWRLAAAQGIKAWLSQQLATPETAGISIIL
jgi:hypothetical protein